MHIIEQSSDLHRGYRRAFVLAVGCAGTLPIYEIIFALLKKEQFGAGMDTLPAVSLEPSYAYFILAALALAVVFLIGLVVRVFLAAKTDQRGAAASTAQKLIGVTTVICMMAESTAVAGFVLALLTRQAIYLHLGVFISLGLTLAYYPRFSQWEEWARILAEREGTVNAREL